MYVSTLRILETGKNKLSNLHGLDFYRVHTKFWVISVMSF